MKRRVLSIIMSALLVGSVVSSASLSASAATSYKNGISVDYANVKLGEGEIYTINVTQNNNQKFIAYDFIPEGNCVKLLSQSCNSKSGTVKVQAFKNRYWSNGDLINVISKQYTNGLSTSQLEQGRNYNKATSVSFSVYNAPKSISINKGANSITVGKGETVTISESTNSGTYANPKNIHWSYNSSNVSVKKGSGNKAQLKGLHTGSARVGVTVYNGVSDTMNVNVKPAPTSVKLNKTSITLKKGQKYTLSECTNSGSYANASNLKWTSSNSKIATVTKGSANKATVTAKAKGTTYVTIKTYNGKTATCKVTVK